MKAYAWNQPKTAVEAHVRWTTALYGPDGAEVYGPTFVNRFELAEQRVAFARLAEKGYTLKLGRYRYYSTVEVCYYCQARPRAIEHDIEAAYRTATCDSEQCRRGHNPDNSGWVAGRGPLWGPGHPEWDRMEEEREASRGTVYTVTSHKTNSGSWCRWSNTRVSESYWMNEPEREERCPADCLASSINVTTEEASA